MKPDGKPAGRFGQGEHLGQTGQDLSQLGPTPKERPLAGVKIKLIFLLDHFTVIKAKGCISYVLSMHTLFIYLQACMHAILYF